MLQEMMASVGAAHEGEVHGHRWISVGYPQCTIPYVAEIV